MRYQAYKPSNTRLVGTTDVKIMSPIEEELSTLPRGNGDWDGWEYVYGKINEACKNFAKSPKTHLCGEHIYSMAVLGCGDEEKMKGHLYRLRLLGYVK